MKIIRQIGIIFTVCWLSLVIEKLLPFTFPASVIGMILLFLCLFTGVLKIEHIQEKADFLLGNMAFFFVPAGVSIMNYFDVLKHSIVQLVFVYYICSDCMEREIDTPFDEKQETRKSTVRRRRKMRELCSSPYFGIALSVLAFGIGVKLNEKLKTPVCNPLVIAIVLIVGVLLIFKIPYEDYNAGGKIINMFLAPATACLAVAIYTKIQVLKQYWLPILVGCTAGSLASMGSVYGLCRLFGLDKSLTVSLLPKSVTTPIAVSISEPAGGVVPITVAAVIGTGILGGIFAPLLIKLFKVSDPVAAGLAIGASSHAVGTSKAIEIGEVEGAMSGLAIGICGIVTVIVSIFLV